MRRRAIWGLLIATPILLVASGSWIAVEPGEVVVIRRLGRALPDRWRPGLHWAWPFGIDRVDRVRLDEVRRIEFGISGNPGPLNESGAGEYLTGDLNLLRARGVVQYRIVDPVAYLLQAKSHDRFLTRLVESSLARALAAREVDAPLRSGRTEVSRDIQASLARSAGALGLGVEILGVNLTDARPPAEVEAAFAEAQSAQAERDRRVVEGRSLASAMKPSTLANSTAKLDIARASAARSSELAKAEATRFLALLGEADRSRALTVRRIFRDALDELMPRVRRKVLMTPDEPVDLGLIGAGRSDR